MIDREHVERRAKERYPSDQEDVVILFHDNLWMISLQEDDGKFGMSLGSNVLVIDPETGKETSYPSMSPDMIAKLHHGS